MKALIEDLTSVIGKCQFSLEGMKYANNDATVLVNSSSVFFPSASWLRAFFHDAGTFIKSPAKGGPKGEQDSLCSQALKLVLQPHGACAVGSAVQK